MSVLDQLSLPVIVAPMAGGPSTPALVRAVAEKSIGFLATGTSTPEQAEADMAACAGTRFGVNLFARQEPLDSLAEVEAVAKQLGAEIPAVDYSNGWDAKFAAVLRHRPAVASVTFGTFSAAEIARLHDAGIEAWVSVASAADARTAVGLGADAIIAQNPRAGGHRFTWSVAEEPGELGEIDVDVPVIAAGGFSTPGDITGGPVMCGSAFLLADEAGTSDANRALLRAGGRTVSTRAFSGRYARGLANEFTDAHPDMPAIYPYLRPMTRRNEYCLVGVGVDKLREGPAAEILEWLGN